MCLKNKNKANRATTTWAIKINIFLAAILNYLINNPKLLNNFFFDTCPAIQYHYYAFRIKVQTNFDYQKLCFLNKYFLWWPSWIFHFWPGTIRDVLVPGIFGISISKKTHMQIFMLSSQSAHPYHISAPLQVGVREKNNRNEIKILEYWH